MIQFRSKESKGGRLEYMWTTLLKFSAILGFFKPKSRAERADCGSVMQDNWQAFFLLLLEDRKSVV